MVNSAGNETKEHVEFNKGVTLNPEVQVETTNSIQNPGNLTFSREVQAPPIPPRSSVGTSPPKLWQITLSQERTYPASDVQ